ncbi:hypothetical protein D3C75_1209290 [compost metagenome]
MLQERANLPAVKHNPVRDPCGADGVIFVRLALKQKHAGAFLQPAGFAAGNQFPFTLHALNPLVQISVGPDDMLLVPLMPRIHQVIRKLPV